MTREAWLARGRELYGEDMRQWKFRCVACGHIQSHELAKTRNPDIGDTSRWIYFSCEGRRNDQVGCDWTLGGLFQIHKLVVTDGEHSVPCFEFADDPENGPGPFCTPAEEHEVRVTTLRELAAIKRPADGRVMHVRSLDEYWIFVRGDRRRSNGKTIVADESRTGRWMRQMAERRTEDTAP